MKKTIITTCLILFTFTSALSQNCSKYYPMEEGVTFQYTSYNKKGKATGSVDYSVGDVTTEGDVTTATMNMKYKDKKGEDVMESSYSFSCSSNVVKIDFHSLMNNQMMQQFEGMEVDVTGTDIELPNDLNVGQELADANVAVNVNMSGVNMKMAVDMTNRKVEKKESITTSAGTFDCYVIYSDNQTKMTMMNRTFPTRMWLAEGVGMVKQESYNTGGKLMNSSVLTAYSN